VANASHTVAARVVTTAVVALLLGACGSTTDTTATPSAASSPTAAASPSAAAVGTSVGVIEKEFSITLAQPSFSAGTFTFAIQNQGSFPHNLMVEGPGVDKKSSPTLAPGASGSLTVDLQKGSYELWCGVDGHKDKGMQMKITVG